ncbi:MAG: DUF1161 domain-containing protein [Sinobacteraceae bacterium]|jgi:hypothetical protein|nr:DUF1161 domain-containing protein [Nevskiaceae bacterium]MDI3261042.1 DUF1161 domain-containing protein [Nevskiaceae bacterium]
MNKLPALLLASLLPVFAHASCDEVKAQIDAKLKAKNIPHYSLEVVPADQADDKDGKVVGSCEGDSKKIVYARGVDDEGGQAPASSRSSG